jgi:hypothetical protein
MGPLVEVALEIARLNLGVRESSGKNRGPVVDLYVRRAGASLGSPWCAAFCYWCFSEASMELMRPCPCPRTASVHRLWRKAAPRFQVPVPTDGSLFLVDHGAGRGHVGLVEEVNGDRLTTIEGNTDASGTREGDGVYRRFRHVDEATLGFLDFSVGHEK